MVDGVTDIIEKKLKINPSQSHTLVYDSPTETLEPLYFWILNFLNNLFSNDVEKLSDNFTSSPGSGHFSELGSKRTAMQERVMAILGGINQVIKTIVNIVYDLKDFEIRLKHYEAANSTKKEEREAGILALKQIWMDNVDIKRGQGSINALTQGNLQFVTLRDAFMVADSVSNVDKIDLNDRVKRILKPRVAEFFEWKKLSEQELKKRFNIEKNYLRSQVNTLKLYSRWIKPYLKAAAQLEMKDARRPELVTVFNTMVLELTLMGKKAVDVKELILRAELPSGIKIPKRKYYEVVIVDLNFVGIPQRPGGQHYAFGGRANVTFKAYAMNEEELKFFKSELEKSEMNDVMKLIEGSTTESLDELQKDIDYFLNDNKKNEKKKPDINPFVALFSIFKRKKEGDKKEEEVIDIKKIKKDSYSESLIRKIAEEGAAEKCFSIFDVYKKSHGMASHDSPFE
ncbi:MAG: hypothetical protein QW727_01610 [Candidatus Pacearchaeota archaeon]